MVRPMRTALLSLLAFGLVGMAAVEAGVPSLGGQDRDRFAAWKAEAPGRAERVAAFEALLRRERVAGVLPTHQVLRTDERHWRCGAPFDLPPRERWDEIVPTLRLLRDEVKPAVGEVEVVSGFRRPAMNRCIGGASKSRHLGFGALDLRPATQMSKAGLSKRLCAVHARIGRQRRMGLGLYPINRFHIDASGYRSWGWDYTGKTSPCPSTGDYPV